MDCMNEDCIFFMIDNDDSIINQDYTTQKLFNVLVLVQRFFANHMMSE